MEEAVEGFAEGDDEGRASALALLLRLVSVAFCGDATLALASFCRATDADADTTCGEEDVHSAKPSQAGQSTYSGWGHAVYCVNQM